MGSSRSFTLGEIASQHLFGISLSQGVWAWKLTGEVESSWVKRKRMNEAFEKPRDANQSLNDKAEKNKKVSPMDMDTLQMANL